MYDKQSNRWKSDCENEDLLKWSREPGSADQPEAQFIQASELLTMFKQGGDMAQAVELMEMAAKRNYPPAMFAMGQMYYWGWAIHKDRKLALEWYRKSAELNYEPAHKELEALKRRRVFQITSVCAAVVTVLLLAAGAVYTLSGTANLRVIKVAEGTQLTEPATMDEFMSEITDLITQYDHELVIQGQVSTNRLLLRFNGNKLDLSEFLADRVVARNDNIVVIQFSSEEEAMRCLETLKSLDNVVYVEMDEYTESTDIIREEDSILPVVTSADPTSDYMSWGVADMGIDQLRDYIASVYPDRTVEIAVIDSGIAPYMENYPHIIENYNLITGLPGSVADEHGSHVTGTILEGILGTGASIHCIDVFNGEDGSPSVASLMAIDLCIEAGMDVINRSMGSSHHSDALVDAVQRAADAGIVVVTSAGNDAIDVNGATTHNCPKEVEDIIVVGAYDINHQAADFSNYGSTVDVCAPGVAIYSLYAEDEDRLISLSGTSMASPHVAALAALVRLIYPDAAPAEVELYIKDYCRTYRNPDMYATGLYGVGAPDATRFIEINPD